MGFKNFLHEYFTFNRRERNGVFVLFSIILLLILYLSFADHFYAAKKIDFSQFEKEIAEFEQEQKRINDSISKLRIYYLAGNTIVSDSSETEHNYSKERRFHKPQETYEKKVINSNLGSSPLGRRDNSKKFLRRGEVIELNSADTTELKKTRGIGSVFAKRIVKFRDALGGFVNKEQLLEVYGFDKEKFDLISSQLILNTSSVKMININSASVYDLEKHPYINTSAAVEIFTRRTTVGDYTDIKEIEKLGFIDEKLFNKIAPYLSIE